MIDRNATSREFTAPTAKFPTDFDRDVDAFTVGSTWYRSGVNSTPVYLMYQWSGHHEQGQE